MEKIVLTKKQTIVSCHFIKEMVKRELKKVYYISSQEMITNCMAKDISLKSFKEHVNTMGLKFT